MAINKRRLLFVAAAIGVGVLLTLLSGAVLAKPPDPERYQYIWTWWQWDLGYGPEDEFTFCQQHEAVTGHAGDMSNFSEWELIGMNTATQTYTLEGALEIYPNKHPCSYCGDDNYFGYYFWLYDHKSTRQVYIQLDWEDRHDEYWVKVTRTSSTRWDYVIYNCDDNTTDATGYFTVKNGYCDPPFAATTTHEYYYPWCNVDSGTRLQTGDGEDWSDIDFWRGEYHVYCAQDQVDDGDGYLGWTCSPTKTELAPNLSVGGTYVANTGCSGPGGRVPPPGAEEAEVQPPSQRRALVIDSETPEECPHPEKLAAYRQMEAAGLLPKPLSQQPWYVRFRVWLRRVWHRIFPPTTAQDTNQWYAHENRFRPLNPHTPTPRPTLEP